MKTSSPEAARKQSEQKSLNSSDSKDMLLCSISSTNHGKY